MGNCDAAPPRRDPHAILGARESMLKRFVRVEWWWAGSALAALHTFGDLLPGFFGQHGVSPLHPHLHLATLVVCAAAGLGSAWSRKLLILWFGWGFGVSVVLAFVGVPYDRVAPLLALHCVGPLWLLLRPLSRRRALLVVVFELAHGGMAAWVLASAHDAPRVHDSFAVAADFRGSGANYRLTLPPGWRLRPTTREPREQQQSDRFIFQPRLGAYVAVGVVTTPPGAPSFDGADAFFGRYLAQARRVSPSLRLIRGGPLEGRPDLPTIEYETAERGDRSTTIYAITTRGPDRLLLCGGFPSGSAVAREETVRVLASLRW